MRILSVIVILSLFACTQTATKPVANIADSVANESASDSVSSFFSLAGPKDTVKNGEEIKRYDNGQIYMRGFQKDGKRMGIWRSWYNNGIPWSETTFENGKKNGRTVTWYENGMKRYEGFYTNDVESGKWTYWDEKGTLTETKEFGVK